MSKQGSIRAWIGRRPVRVDSRYSAALIYSAARRAGMDRRMAYLCVVARCGWDRQSRLASIKRARKAAADAAELAILAGR